MHDTSARPSIRLADAARRLRMQYNSAWRLVLIGELDGDRVGNRLFVYVDSLEHYEAKRQPAAMAA